jgi:SAM-dependent methyltransferase
VSATATHELNDTVERQACAWCLSPIDETAQRRGGVAFCGRCGVGNTYPRPTDAELNEAYASWYRPSSGRFSGIGDAVLRRTRGRLASRMDRIAPAGRVLDVGAGDGSLLDALAARGREVLGLERESNRPDMRSGDLGDLDGEWAAIVLWHSLEHLGNAGEEINRAASLLAPSGVLVIAVPNVGSLQAQVFGERWLALDLPRHLVHLPSRALIERLQQLSLEIERVSYWRGGQVVFGWLHGLVRALPGQMNLYDAIRRSEARQVEQSSAKRLVTLTVATALAPLAIGAAVTEVAVHRGGTIYVEARRV